MVQNIAIVGLNRKKTYEIGKLLATRLEMLFFDCLELYEFDNIPRNLTIMLKEFGEKYYRQKERGMLKYVSEFSNTLINLESGMASRENFKTIKSNCLLLYFHQSKAVVKKQLESTKYISKEQEKFFSIGEKQIERRIEAYKKNADIVICASGSKEKIVDDAIRKINAFFGAK